MTASMYQGEGGYMDVMGRVPKTKLAGPIHALEQGSVGKTMSDLQFMMENERKQHEQGYRYAKGHNDGGGFMGTPSF